jgi:hypothetical protein
MIRNLFRRPGSSASQPSGLTRPKAGRNRSRRLGLEALEDRRLLSVTASVVDRELLVLGDNTPNQITLNHSGGTTSVTWQGGFAAAADSAFDRIAIHTGQAAGDYVLVAGTPAGKYLFIQDHGGSGLIRIGRPDSRTPLAQTVLSRVLVSSRDPINLQIYDGLDQTRQTAYLEDWDPGTGTTSYGQVRGLTPQPIQYLYKVVGELDVDSGRDAIINVRQTGSRTHLFTSQPGGITSINLGDQGSLKGIRQRLGITSQGSLVDLALSAVNDAASPNVVITRNPLPENPVYAIDMITGLTPADMIYYTTATTRSVAVQTSRAGATVNVRGLGAETYLLGNGDNTLTVGNSGSLRLMDANLHVGNNAGTTAITVDGSADGYTFSQNVRVGVPAPDGFSNLVDGLWSHSLFYRASTTRSLTVRGPGGITFAVPGPGSTRSASTPAAATTPSTSATTAPASPTPAGRSPSTARAALTALSSTTRRTGPAKAWSSHRRLHRAAGGPASHMPAWPARR